MINRLTKLQLLPHLALLALVLMRSMSTALPVHASGGSCGADLTWSLSGGTLTISGTGEMTNFSDENMPPW